ncbi:beta-1,6-glucan synthase [Betaproteobacteria bacterium]|nr:beta-1,6-glucan synthase [Betaproteobacteria bacterium]
MSESPRRLWAALVLVHLSGLVALIWWLLAAATPVPMPGLQLGAGEKLRCVSYAPFHRPGQTPFDPDTVIPRAQIEADLRALAPITDCVRLYSIDMGLDQVPELARQLGLKVLLGAWIGYDREKNTLILDRAIELANTHPDVVGALIVGNEVLLRREQSVDELRALITYARERTALPVTYADVWEFWLKNDSLADAVDFITIHILPFWEDEPVDIALALEHVVTTRAKVKAHFGGKPLLIGETGWPGAGRQREASLPSRVNQARFVREFVHLAHAQGWNYNLIEAIDQPWKRRLEGTVGGYWGMLDADTLQPNFPLAGPVAERDSIQAPLVGGAIGAVLALCLALIGRVRPFQPLRLAAVTLVGANCGLIAVLHAEHAWLAYRDMIEWLALGAVALAAVLVGLVLARWQGKRLPPADLAWQRIKKREWVHKGGAAEWLALLRGFILFAAAIAALLLFVDPRYRDFPNLLYLAPATVYGVISWQRGGEFSRSERLCATLITLCVLGRWMMEPLNPQAVLWLLTGLALAWPVLDQRFTRHYLPAQEDKQAE